MVTNNLTSYAAWLLRSLILIAILSFYSIPSFCQVDREFWFAIPKETDGHSSISSDYNVSFKITAMSLDARVKISMPANPAFPIQQVTIPAGTSDIIILAENYTEFAAIYNNNATLTNSTISGKTNRGILIESDNDITVYYDYNNFNNRDLFSLKGKNALGSEFYTPFQTIWNNGSNYNPDPYSSIEIVATEDGTEIDIYPTKKFQGYAFPGVITIKLDRGEAYTLRAEGYNPADHPTGTRIVAKNNKKIAVITNDDSVRGALSSCYDILGDQLVPVNVIGTKYLVMTGDKSATNSTAGYKNTSRGEQVIVVATEDNTVINFYDKNGTLLTNYTLNKQGSDYFSPDITKPEQTSIYIDCADPSKKFYVFHVTGIDCELGGAILPPITDCTGSSEVSFYRSNIVDNPVNGSMMSLNLMIPYDKTKLFTDPSQSYRYFFVHYEDKTSVQIDPSWFEPISVAGWAVLKPAYRGDAGIGTLVPVNKATKISNTSDFFHLGLTNGWAKYNPATNTWQRNTNKYGYFSSFNVARAEVRVASTESQEYIGCYGQKITLVAKGGLEYTWHYGSPSGPPTYLNDSKSPNPDVNGAPTGSHNYYVEIRQAKCFGIDTSKVNVTILPRTTALFEVDRSAICAVDTINFTNQSTESHFYYWKKQVDNYPAQKFFPTDDMSFDEILDNKSTAPVRIKYFLTAEHLQGCNDTISRVITVYPRINADFSPSVVEGCHPLPVSFTNKSGGNLDLYTWDFGDQGSSNIADPLHTFEHKGKNDTTYNVKLTVKSPYFCTDDTTQKIRVFPFIKAGFTVDTVKGCSPLTIKISNNSLNRKAISEYNWNFGDGVTRIVNKDTLIHTYPVNVSDKPVKYKLLLTVKHPYDNGCPDTISRMITVYPQSDISFTSIPGSSNVCDSTMVAFTTTASPAITSYLWDFGDGSTSVLKDPSHLFTNLTEKDITYKVKLTGISNEYCNGYTYKDITVHAYLDPRFAINLPSSCAPFDANIKNNSRGGITSYLWKYGDGTSDKHSVTDTTHRFRNSTGDVFAPQVKLVVTNSGGCKDSVMQRINVYPEIKATFSTPTILGCNPLSVTFTNNSQYVTNHQWDFGDKTSSSLQNPVHVFTNTTQSNVAYPVKLTVTSPYNCADDTIININVFPFIEADFSVDTVNGCSPFEVNIHNASRGNAAQSLWEFEPGNVASNPASDFSHIYSNTTAHPISRYLKLVASNSGACKSRDFILITVYPEVNTNFTTNVIEGCNPLVINYTNLSGPESVPSTYNWTFGDGGTSVIQNTSHTFENLTSSDKIFTTTLKAYSIYNCVDSSKVNIKVYPFIKADFSFDESVGCSPHTISITNSSSAGVNGVQWFFGDGNPTNEPSKNFTHVYRNLTSGPRTFYPKLVVNYNNNCHDTIIQSVQVFPEVTAQFRADTLKGCHPLEITFTNTSINATRYNWIFGDKGTSVVQHPRHTYTNFSNVDSVYNLSLSATSIYNCKDTINKKVTIYARPKALLDVANSVNCPPYLLPITNLSEAGDFYHWNFGDGDSTMTDNLSTVSHTYDNLIANTVTYDLKLFVRSINNCTDQIHQSINIYPRVIADFTPDESGCSPLLVPFENNTLRATTYKWDFGDKITSALKNPTHKFFNNSIEDTTFNVRLIGFSQFGCSDTAFRQIVLHPQPLVEFSALPSHLYYPDARVNLDNQTNAGNWNYLWNFDDGKSSTLIEPGTHEFLRWGTFNVKLNAWSDYCSDSISHRIRVYAPKTIADFDASGNGCVPLKVNFTNHSTWATSYKWEFDDGSVSTEANPSYTYTKPGKYQVKLTTYGDGAEDVTYREVEVYPKPIVGFDVSPRYVMLPEALVHYYNVSKLGNRYLWNFGDGDTSTLFEPTHMYKDLGTYDITLNVWTEHQCFDSVVMPRAVKVDGNGLITFPNAFKPSVEGPNGGRYSYPDTKNTVFHPYHDGVAEYKLEIYDRWGELLFESKDVNIGWDGYYKNELCKSDVYIWKAKGKFYNGSDFSKAGDVTLLR